MENVISEEARIRIVSLGRSTREKVVKIWLSRFGNYMDVDKIDKHILIIHIVRYEFNLHRF